MATTLLKKIKFGNGTFDAIEIHCGTSNPENSITAPSGSIYIHTVVPNVSVYQKTSASNLNTGWKPLGKKAAYVNPASATISDVVNALISADLMSSS